MMHVGNNTTEETNQAIKRTKKVHGVIEYIEKQFQKYFFTLCPCCTNSLSKTAHLLALGGYKIPSQRVCRNFSKRDNRKGLMK
jgi:glutaminase